MKRKIVSILMLIALVLGISQVSYASTETALVSKLKSVTNKPIVKMFYEDFNNDGFVEVFAFTGEILDNDEFPAVFSGEMWYVSENRVEQIQNPHQGGLGIVMNNDWAPSTIKQNGTTVLIFNHIWGNGMIRTAIFSVNKEMPNVKAYSGTLTSSPNGFLMYNEAYDFVLSKEGLKKGSYFGMGRTSKVYWYYWDVETNQLKEYGAIPISKEQFLTFDGAQEILNSITSGTVYNILYRGNGIININVCKDSSMFDDNDAYEFSYIIAEYDDNSVRLSDSFTTEYNEGFYLDALDTQSATYPEFRTPDKIKVTLNGAELAFDQPPIMAEGDRVMVPIRFIFEAMGYAVNWNGYTQTAEATKAGDKIVVQINNNIINYTVDGISGTYVCDVVPQIISERTLVPVRAIAECAGCYVDWDGANQTVIITYN